MKRLLGILLCIVVLVPVILVLTVGPAPTILILAFAAGLTLHLGTVLLPLILLGLLVWFVVTRVRARSAHHPKAL